MIVVCKDKTAFETCWYSYENCWNDNIMCIINDTNFITFDGIHWKEIKEDHL